MKALVTGGTGFVGSAVVRALIRHGWQVRVLARPGADDRNIRALAAERVTGDVLDRRSLDEALKTCDALFHVAAEYRFGTRDPAALYRTNVEGTRNVLAAAAHSGVRRVVHTSSVATIGQRADNAPACEMTPATLEDMIGHYKRSKYLAEELAIQAASAGADVVIVNPSTPVGPGDLKPTPTGRMVLDAASGRMPAYVKTGLNVVHVDDVAEGHVLAFERGRSGQRYILGGENMSLRSLLHEIARIAGCRAPSIRLPHAAVMPVAYASELVARMASRPAQISIEAVRMARKPMYFSSEKAVRGLGYAWRDPVEGLEEAVKWFREQELLPRDPAARRGNVLRRQSAR